MDELLGLDLRSRPTVVREDVCQPNFNAPNESLANPFFHACCVMYTMRWRADKIGSELV